MYWINTWSKGALAKQKDEPIVPRGSLNVDSYFGHSFLVVEDKVCVYVYACFTYIYMSLDAHETGRASRMRHANCRGAYLRVIGWGGAGGCRPVWHENVGVGDKVMLAVGNAGKLMCSGIPPVCSVGDRSMYTWVDTCKRQRNAEQAGKNVPYVLARLIV